MVLMSSWQELHEVTERNIRVYRRPPVRPHVQSPSSLKDAFDTCQRN